MSGAGKVQHRVTGRGSWKLDRPLLFEAGMGYLWIGQEWGDHGVEFVGALSPAMARKLLGFLKEHFDGDQ